MLIVACTFLLLIPPTLSGEAEIDGFGKIFVPAGEWILEFSHQVDAEKRIPEVFILKRQSDELERITILRYRNSLSGMKWALGDSIADSTIYGVPNRFRREFDLNAESSGTDKRRTVKVNEIEMIRLPPDMDASRLEVTNAYVDEEGKNWMNHGVIVSDGEYVIVAIHTSSRILMPEVALDIASSLQQNQSQLAR